MVENGSRIRVRLGALMGEKDINISELARALDVSWPTAQQLRRGDWPRLSGEQFARLCELFEVQPGDILSLEPSTLHTSD